MDHDLVPPDSAPRAGVGLLVVAATGEFLVVLDASVVNVALPAVQAGLGFGAAGLTWVVNAYALVFAGFLLLGGRVGDAVGRRRAFVGGLGVFVAASVVGGFALSAAMLVVSRAVQALGAAVLAPASLAVLMTSFPEGRSRARALAVWTAVASAGGAAGSLLGGVLTEYGTWRATLLINVPVGVAVLIVARFLLANDARAPTGRTGWDVPGAVSATVGAAALAFAATGGREYGWGSPVVVGAFTVATAVLALFVLVEARWSPSPLLPLRMLRSRAVGVGNVAMVLAGACLMPMWYFLSLYLQQGLGLTPLLAGLGFLPHTAVTVVVGARAAPWLMERLPARVLVVAGCVVTAVGFLWQGSVTEADTYWSGVLGAGVVLSVGGGLLNTPLTTLVTSGVDPADAGAASGLMNTTKQLGGALGLAVLVSALGGAAHDPGSGPAPVTAMTADAFTTMGAVLLVVALIGAALPRRTTPARPTGDRP